MGNFQISNDVGDLMGKTGYLKGYRSQMIRLLAHLLKWVVQPERRCSSWTSTIRDARSDIEKALGHSKNMETAVRNEYPSVYPASVRGFAKDTALSKTMVPNENPWTLDQIVAEDFWPESFEGETTK